MSGGRGITRLKGAQGTPHRSAVRDAPARRLTGITVRDRGFEVEAAQAIDLETERPGRRDAVRTPRLGRAQLAPSADRLLRLLRHEPELSQHRADVVVAALLEDLAALI